MVRPRDVVRLRDAVLLEPEMAQLPPAVELLPPRDAVVAAAGAGERRKRLL